MYSTYNTRNSQLYINHCKMHITVIFESITPYSVFSTTFSNSSASYTHYLQQIGTNLPEISASVMDSSSRVEAARTASDSSERAEVAGFMFASSEKGQHVPLPDIRGKGRVLTWLTLGSRALQLRQLACSHSPLH